MAMNRHHTGSGRRRAVPATWGADHAQVAAGSRNATVTLRHPSTGTTWDPNANGGTGATVPAVGAAYATAVSARIQARTTLNNAGVDVAEETVTAPPYLVAVDFGQDAREGDVVQVTACVGDAALVGRRMRVDDVEHGTERFERDLFCTLIDD